MKKIIFYVVLGFLLFANQKSFAGGLSEEKTKIWRSTEICGALTDMQISTVSSYLYMLQVTSGSAAISQFEYINSSSAISDTGAERSTSTVYDVDTSGDKWEIRREMSRGFRIRTIGNACISCLWDFTVHIPLGHIEDGYVR